MIHVGICDDDKGFLKGLREFLLREYPRQLALHEYSRGTELLHSFRQHEVLLDVILLDIEMPVLDGIETAQHIRELDSRVVIIFLTQWDGYVRKSFEVQPFQYVDKPIERESFLRIFSSALTSARRTRIEESLLVETKSAQIRIPLGEIIMIECEDKMLVVHRTDQQIYRYYGSLRSIAGKLSQHGFFYANKSYLLNIPHIIHVDKDLGVAFLEEGHKAFITKSKVRPLLLERQKWYIG